MFVSRIIIPSLVCCLFGFNSTSGQEALPTPAQMMPPQIQATQPGYPQVNVTSHQQYHLPPIAGLDCQNEPIYPCYNVQNCSGHGGSVSTHRSCACGGPHFFQDWWYSDAEYFQYQHQSGCVGEATRSFLQAQKYNGLVAQLVFNHIHFTRDRQTGAWTMSQAGWRNAALVARIKSSAHEKIRVTPTGNAQLDQQRMQLVAHALVQSGLQCDPSDLVLAYPNQNGIPGIESGLIYEQRLLGSPYQGQANSFGSSSSNQGVSSGASGLPGSNQ